VMKCSRSPLRVSLFGGGTDYPEFFFKHDFGLVVGFTINKYIRTVVTDLSPVLGSRIKMSYRIVEEVASVSDLQHPLVREVLLQNKFTKPVNISTMADLPGQTGLGSSSAFAAGFIQLINSVLDRQELSKDALAKEAVRFERKILSEEGGLQDQYHTAFGGFNAIRFSPKGVYVQPLKINETLLNLINEHLVLIYSGKRSKQQVGGQNQAGNLMHKANPKSLLMMREITEQGIELLMSQHNVEQSFIQICDLLQKSWRLKQEANMGVSNPTVGRIYEKAMEMGALAGKLCGAGDGGFLVFFAPMDVQNEMKKVFKNVLCTDVVISNSGSLVFDGV